MQILVLKALGFNAASVITAVKDCIAIGFDVIGFCNKNVVIAYLYLSFILLNFVAFYVSLTKHLDHEL